MAIIHLNDYPVESRYKILDDLAAEMWMLMRYALNGEKFLWKMSYELKNIGTKDPTITITGNNIDEVWGVHTIIEV